MATRGRDEQIGVHTITSAPVSRRADIAARQRRYLISMSIRLLCFAGFVLVGPGWFRWVLLAGAVLLPYVAVVGANAPASRHEGVGPESPGEHQLRLPPAHH